MVTILDIARYVLPYGESELQVLDHPLQVDDEHFIADGLVVVTAMEMRNVIVVGSVGD